MNASVVRAIAVGLFLIVGLPATAGEVPALRARIESFVRARAATPPTRIEVPPLDDFTGADLPPGNQEVRLQVSPRERMSGSVPITVVQLVEGREARRGTVTVRVETSARALVVARDLPRGTRVRDEDVVVRSVPAQRIPPGAVREAARLVGLRTTRQLAAGTLWRRGWVREAPRVSRGELVPLRLERGPLSIQAVGKARDEGRAGDRVRVLNVDSRREVVGVVGEDGVVRVVF